MSEQNDLLGGRPDQDIQLRKVDTVVAVRNQIKVNFADSLTSELIGATAFTLDESSARYVVGDGDESKENPTDRSLDPHARFVASLISVSGDRIDIDVSSVEDIQGVDPASGKPLREVAQESVIGGRTETPREILMNDGARIFVFNYPRYQEQPDGTQPYDPYAVRIKFTPSTDLNSFEIIRELEMDVAGAASEHLVEILQQAGDYDAVQNIYRKNLQAENLS